MEYIAKTADSRPAALDEYEKDKDAWVVYYQTKPRPSKPPDHWIQPEVREPLARQFLHCCGYCGVSLDIKEDASRKIYTGEVDHYRPKSKHPALVFDWENLVWSCSDCNSQKGSKDDPQCLILHPCRKADVALAKLDENTGCYQPTPQTDTARFNKTDQQTWLNASTRANARKLAAREFRTRLQELATQQNFSELGLEDAASVDGVKSELIGWIKTGYRPMLKRIFGERREEHAFTFESLMNP